MDNIQVTFEFKGKEYKGFLSQVAGSGSTASYHLSVEGYYCGQLFYVQLYPGNDDGRPATEGGWQFSSNVHPELDKQAEFFGYVITAWMDSRV